MFILLLINSMFLWELYYSLGAICIKFPFLLQIDPQNLKIKLLSVRIQLTFSSTDEVDLSRFHFFVQILAFCFPYLVLRLVKTFQIENFDLSSFWLKEISTNYYCSHWNVLFIYEWRQTPLYRGVRQVWWCIN